MKKFAILFSLVVSVMMLGACASKGTTDQAPQTVTAPTHHDLKGEVSK